MGRIFVFKLIVVTDRARPGGTKPTAEASDVLTEEESAGAVNPTKGLDCSEKEIRFQTVSRIANNPISPHQPTNPTPVADCT